MLLIESLEDADPGGFEPLVNVPMIFGIIVNVFLDMVGVKVGYNEPIKMFHFKFISKLFVIIKNDNKSSKL